jgi:hypothetical protein
MGLMFRWLRSAAFVIISVGLAILMTFPLRHVAVHNLGLFLIAAVMLGGRYERAAGVNLA